MQNTEKCDPKLGRDIRAYLERIGVETPIDELTLAVSDKEKQELIEEKMADVMKILGLDLEDDSLVDTPRRIAKMFVKELYWGLKAENFPKCTAVDNKMQHDEMILEKCTVKSTCEHHFVYFGTAHNPEKLGCWVAYIPKNKILGLSKLNRIVEYFSHRPQIQERLTEQVFHALRYILQTDDIAVLIRSQHFCVLTRGVEDTQGLTVTSKLGGAFQDGVVRSEFMSLAKG